MSPKTKQTMLHFLHHHPLQEIENNILEYLCDGCKTPGISTRYRCNICDVDLHECCATSSPRLASFMHPRHELSLVVQTSKLNTFPIGHRCNFCGDEVEGLFYRCNICDFDIHPVCTQLPEYICYDQHFIHPLKFEAGPAGLCSICYDVCTSWRYRCGMCNFNIHLECILAPPSLPPPPPPIPPPFYVGVGVPPTGYVGFGVPAASYVVHNNPYQYTNAYNQYASGSSGAVPSKGKPKFGKKVGLFVGRMAISIASGALGVPDVSSFF